MSPSRGGGWATVFYMYYSGYLYNEEYGVDASSWGVRPVINLKADVTISSGNGTATSPYEIS